MAKTFVVIGDTHFPFANTKTLYGKGGVLSAIKQLQPDYVIQVGDLYDMYSWSRFPFKRDVYTPEQEIKKGRAMAEQLWAKVQKAAPKAKCFQLKGNHDERPTKRLMERNPEFLSIMRDPLHDLFVFDRVKTQNQERDPLVLEGIMFMHGFRSKLGDHAIHNHMRTVCGHSHVGGCVFVRRGDDVLWELNVGFTADEYACPMSYTRNRLVSRWTQGYGIIDGHGPRFVAMGGGK